jgi:lipopolysaccharide/colanic/teichoic acid biosynthesis glycosyltransferase
VIDMNQLSTAAPAAIHTTEDWSAPAAGTRTAYERRFKRLLDVAVALVAMVVLLPLMLVVGILVRVFLGSGVLYRQVRVGRDGQNFVMLKFRTMKHRDTTVEEVTDHSATHKSKDHPRTTRLGRSQAQHGRIAAVVERAARPDEPRWPTAGTEREGRRLRIALPRTARRAPRLDR